MVLELLNLVMLRLWYWVQKLSNKKQASGVVLSMKVSLCT